MSPLPIRVKRNGRTEIDHDREMRIALRAVDPVFRVPHSVFRVPCSVFRIPHSIHHILTNNSSRSRLIFFANVASVSNRLAKRRTAIATAGYCIPPASSPSSRRLLSE
jgi:hypothetical protein